MQWATRYRRWLWIRTNMWLVPMAYAAAAVCAGILVPRWDEADPIDLGYSSSSMATALNSISTGMIAFTGLVFSIVLLIVQFGSGAFSTRLMRWFWRSLVVKNALGIFVATFLFSLLGLADIDRGVATFKPTRTFVVSYWLVLLSVALFLALLARMTGLLRVARVTRELAAATIDEIERTTPAGPHPPGGGSGDVGTGRPDRLILHESVADSIMAVDKRGLVALAERDDVCVRLLPAVGQHVRRDEVLFEVYGTLATASRRYERGVIFGEERTIDGDPLFGVRLLVDIALKALSAAVNDPTTAVQVLDRLEDVLWVAARRGDASGIEVDGDGRPRLLSSPPTWRDLLELSLDEIMVYGATAPQVMRRIGALLDKLDDERVADDRRRLVHECRERWLETVQHTDASPWIRAFSLVPDAGGIGPGSLHPPAARPDTVPRPEQETTR